MKTIISIHNEEVKAVAALKNSKDRDDQGRFVAEGLRVISTFMQAGWKPTMLYSTEKMMEHAQKLTAESNITLVSPEVIKKISQATTPSELLAIFRIPVSPDMSTLASGLVMAHLADPGNVGTLMRTCAAMNVQSVVMVEGVDPWHPKVIQASAGTIALLKIFQISWQELVANKGALKLYALTVTGGKEPKNIDTAQALIVVGNEAHGLPAEWIAQCDGAITIPMPGNTESLNAAVAGSIALYELFNGR